MEGRFKLIMALLIAISCFYITCDALTIPHEISKRVIPDPIDILKTARSGSKSIVAATDHMVDNEFALIEAKKEPVPVSSGKTASSSEFGASTADLVPATAKKGGATTKKGGATTKNKMHQKNNF
ncbi:hypothetical protein BDF21DRAFT_489422 [Thamnidium elegans]|uniref:Uncharacterized protein n=1 Tax=Thamnidium elegans TaxID=101142 RepID=A0A8H7SXT8_9FUNG|nr:hypothetical protein INT48_001778 [Thamnidium elegans]KAI8095995.1 hypothetical protein BDF21DRAFT_489422 [Thamnidium elegans]